MPSEGVPAESTRGDIGEVYGTLSHDELRSRLVECELRVLELRDQLIGTEAARQELETRLDGRLLDSAYRANSANFLLEQEIVNLNVHIANHLAHIARLEEALASMVSTNQRLTVRSDELNRIHLSTSWKIARALMIPRRLWLRVLGRR